MEAKTTRLPCGCILDEMIVDGVNTLALTACPAGEDCQYVRYCIEESNRQGKPTTVVEA